MHRKILTSLTVAILVGWAITSNSLVQGAAQAAPAWTLEEVLAGMDRASDGFRDMSAAVERAAYTAFLDNSRSEFGRMYFVRGDRSRIRISLEEPAPREFLIDEGQVRIYNPRTNVLEEIALGEHEDKVEFMVIGFGTSRTEILGQYDVSLAGPDSADGAPGGRLLPVVDLVPKDPNVRRHFSQIRLWMDPETWTPVRTRAMQSGGDHLTVYFSEVAINEGVDGSAFSLDLPDDVEIVRH
jgi:outer membrane lipoprotein-sorting protein